MKDVCSTSIYTSRCVARTLYPHHVFFLLQSVEGTIKRKAEEIMTHETIKNSGLICSRKSKIS